MKQGGGMRVAEKWFKEVQKCTSFFVPYCNVRICQQTDCQEVIKLNKLNQTKINVCNRYTFKIIK